MTNQPRSYFILCYFTIKPPVHRRIKKRRISHLCNFTFKLCLTLISLSCLSVASSIIVPLHTTSPKDAPLHAASPQSHSTLPYFALHCPALPYIALCCIKSDSFRNPPYLLYLLYFIIPHRLLKKGSTSPHTIIHFAGSSHCKHITVLLFWCLMWRVVGCGCVAGAMLLSSSSGGGQGCEVW